MGCLRSPTAAWLYSMTPGFATAFAGTEEGLGVEHLRWATHVVCMEERHCEFIISGGAPEGWFDAVCGKRVIVLGIPDIYLFMDDDLLAAIESRAAEHLGAPHKPEDFEARKLAARRERYG